MRAVNLIPSEQRSGGSVGARSEGAAFAVLGLLAGLAVLAFLYGSARHTYTSRRAEVAALTARAQDVREQTTRLASYTSFVAMREQRIRDIAQLVGSRFDWAGAMGELSRVLPPDVSLSSIQATVGSTTGSTGPTAAAAPAAGSSATGAAAGAAAPVSSATPPGAVPTFTLAGCAASQTTVAQTLVRLRLVSGVSNVTLLSSVKSSSGGGSGGSGSCPKGGPAFSAQVSFQPLPVPPGADISAIEAASAPSSGAKKPVSDRSKGARR
jgi:Tfp pilus assembly protein PilN